MPMRLSGLMSGMDTESVIQQLVEAKKTKVTKAVKAQKSLKYKQDAWKDLNKKILNLYNKTLSNLRFESSFIKKTTKVSNSSVVSVITGENAMNSVQNLTVTQLASTGFLTGGELKSTAVDEKGNPIEITGKTTLGDLGVNFGDGETGQMTVDINGQKTLITVGSNTTIDSFLGTLRNAGLNANFDETNKRIYVSSKASGKDNDFSIYASDANGLKALQGMGLDYVDDALKGQYQAIIDGKDDTLKNRLDSQLRSLVFSRETLHERLGAVVQGLDAVSLAKVKDNLTGDAFTQTITTQDEEGNEVEKTVSIGEEGFDYSKLSDADWNELNTAVMAELGDDDTIKNNLDAANQALEDAKAAYETANQELEDARAALEANPEDEEAIQAVADAENKAAAALDAVADAEAKVATAQKAQTDASVWTANWESLEDVNGRLQKDTNGEWALSADEEKRITEAVDAEVQRAQDLLNDINAMGSAFSGKKAAGQDAIINLNNVDYKSSKNTFEINGLTLTVSAKTAPGETVTITTEDDTNGIYDMIKNFFKEYNSLINEMDKLYNADSAKGYDPLTDEEKDAMSDTAIEEWENKIKESILRRDSTLGTFADAMKTIMMEGVEVNGKKMYLSNFGINTLSYFSAAENERNAYHIDGDPDDENTSGNADRLKSMIANDPDTVVSFFTQLSQKMYDKMFDLMKADEAGYSSSFTVYEDKKMQKDYDDYTAKIKELEKKLADYEDKWYAKFAAMETALAKMQSNASAVTSLLGG